VRDRAIDRRVAGVSLPEALVALLLGLFVAHLGLSTLARLRELQHRLSSRADAIVSMRVARHALRSELRRGLPGVDWEVGGDSLSLRAFRGSALLCPHVSASADLVVWFTGDRRPDPAKDSVVLVEADGTSQLRDLVAVGPAPLPCGSLPADSLEVWTLDAPAYPDIVLARLFERGSYHLALSALRYRRGNSGRQPLTPEVWEDAGTGWVEAGGRLGMGVHHAEEADSAFDWSAFLAWRSAH